MTLTSDLPPLDRNAERSALGSMLRDNRCIADVAVLVRPDDFRVDSHQRVCRAVLELFRDGKPADLVTVNDVLARRGDIGPGKDVSYAYLAELWDAAPTAANAEYYARIVRDRSIQFRLHCAGQQIQHATREGSAPAEELLAEAERQIFAIAQLGANGQAVTLDAAANEACARYDQIASGERPLSGVPTGFIDLDNLLAGLHRGELTVIGARPSTGKTALALNLLRNVAGEGVPAFFASLEQSRVEVAERMIAAEARVNGQKLRRVTCNADELERIAAARPTLRSLPVHIDDTPGQSMMRILGNARRLQLRHGIGLIVVDYLQLIEPENRKEPRQEQVALISRRLKLLARELSVPVVALAQLNRASEDRAGGRPRLSDLRESGAQEQDADVVLLLHKQDDEGNVIEVIVAKQRNGPVGEVALAFDRQTMRFHNFAWEPGQHNGHRDGGRAP